MPISSFPPGRLVTLRTPVKSAPQKGYRLSIKVAQKVKNKFIREVRSLSENERDTREDDKDSINIPLTALLQWIPIWLALIGMFLSAANVYANLMTRVGTLETRLNLYGEVISDIKDDVATNDRQSLRTRQEGQDREQAARDKDNDR